MFADVSCPSVARIPCHAGSLVCALRELLNARAINELNGIAHEAPVNVNVGVVEPQGFCSIVVCAVGQQRVYPTDGSLEIVAVSRISLAAARKVIVVVGAVVLARGSDTPLGFE